jgi:hypothetical protein
MTRRENVRKAGVELAKFGSLCVVDLSKALISILVGLISVVGNSIFFVLAIVVGVIWLLIAIVVFILSVGTIVVARKG